ncbi:MFS transporter [Flavimaricola marinus]|uniref:Inner membrane protein YbjJ n=1 Tax=Flavimaricola marinus TaxID=1819565 RepID=A0A238LH67_9RHOB|nr:MFS transporter [Flavimaricola marinus]SMY09039.1 Inner membrane protein YbjJ [Flavimaricola marinus]
MSLRGATILTMAVFALQPLAFGAWLALIPHVKADLGLSKAELAIALLGMPVALVPSLQIAARVLGRYGPRRVLAVAFPVQTPVVLLPLLAVGQGSLFAALAALGVVLAFLQVSLNVYAGRLEKSAGVVIMSRCHGFWALGLMAGSLVAAVLVALPDVLRLGGIAVLSSVAGMAVALALPKLSGSETGSGPPRRALRRIPPVLFAISLFALAIGMTEGAMSDWSAVYMAERWPEGAGRAGLAVSLYAGCVAVGRFLGDAATTLLGRVRLARGASLVALAGLAMIVGPWSVPVAFAGFAIVGLGVSIGFPLAVSAAAGLDDTYESANIAVLSTISLCGFLIGPPMIGFLADGFSLRVGLSALFPLLAVSVWLSGALRPSNPRNQVSDSPILVP